MKPAAEAQTAGIGRSGKVCLRKLLEAQITQKWEEREGSFKPGFGRG